MEGELQQLAEGSMPQGDLGFGRKMWAHCEALTAGKTHLLWSPTLKGLPASEESHLKIRCHCLYLVEVLFEGG